MKLLFDENLAPRLTVALFIQAQFICGIAGCEALPMTRFGSMRQETVLPLFRRTPILLAEVPCMEVRRK